LDLLFNEPLPDGEFVLDDPVVLAEFLPEQLAPSVPGGLVV